MTSKKKFLCWKIQRQNYLDFSLDFRAFSILGDLNYTVLYTQLPQVKITRIEIVNAVTAALGDITKLIKDDGKFLMIQSSGQTNDTKCEEFCSRSALGLANEVFWEAVEDQDQSSQKIF